MHPQTASMQPISSAVLRGYTTARGIVMEEFELVQFLQSV